MRPVKFSDDLGSAVLDFIGFGLFLQLPLLLIAISFVEVQHDQLAAEAITREALRSLTLLGSDVATSANEIADSYRVPRSKVKVVMSCSPQECTEGAWVSLTTKVGIASATAAIQK